MDAQPTEGTFDSMHARAEAALGFEDDETQSKPARAARFADEAHEELEAGSVTGKLLTRR
jgi:hypothetical protein